MCEDQAYDEHRQRMIDDGYTFRCPYCLDYVKNEGLCYECQNGETAMKGKMQQVINPSWIKPSMTVLQAANQADARGCTLKVSWNSWAGMRIVAVPKDE